MFKKISLNYNFNSVLAADYEIHSGSCIFHQARENPTIYKTGQHITSFNDSNTIIHQLWWNRDQLDFDDIGNQLGIEVVTISSIRQDPGNVIPCHHDQFKKMSSEYPDRKELKVRANLFLEVSKIGHILQFMIDDTVHTASEWKANEGYLFDSSVPHLSCNAGLEPKYTLQISGFLLNQSQ